MAARSDARNGEPVRVLIACDHMDFAGALHGGGRQLIELVRALDRERIEPTACILRAPSSLGLELQREGMPLHFLGDGRFNPVTIAKLVRLIRRRRIEVMHLTDFGSCTFGRIAAALTGTPAIVQVISHHSELTARGFPPYVELAYRILAPLTSKALAISPSVKEFSVEHMGFAPENVEVLYYPLPSHSFSEPSPESVAELRQRLGIANGDRVIGSITRFYPVKGINYLIDAFARLAGRYPRARLILVGKGPEEERLRRQCRELGIDGRVIFAGFQREVQRFVKLFDVSVVPSLEEGFGLVALESLALGVPVVASRLGGLPDVVTHGTTGLLVEAANPVAIADAIASLLADDELRRRMGDAGPATAQRYSLDGYAGRLTEIYQELAAGGTSPAMISTSALQTQ
ncbi:MAG TPA: glycosyltransferase family 4 protein [Gemmatimonadaceae bacterium]|nr:glycosyltransferase family 4 protein [Gemmatimonadaceae bacterium]